MRCLLAATSAFAASASSRLPSRMSSPIFFETALRSACSFSTSAMTERRSSSSSKKRSRSQWAFWRDAQDLSTTSGFSLTNLMSSIDCSPYLGRPWIHLGPSELGMTNNGLKYILE